ncbi:WD repeat-containing protein 35 [Copidosoma floridanum]|uniref:WD repeat-containing protein 35 n=1 Tax=Copidosoma floridanum TaxID=29053 RepID=UPI000C6F5116|nr:WD repeat-containing protein 35 [Copidosoma floridanum]
MFIFLSKKIAIPNNVHLNCIAWNQKQGYIAVGGEDGMLKVVRAESSAQTSDASSQSNRAGVKTAVTNSSNLSMNQTLEGHNGQVQVVTWNEEHQKLTSSDQNGVIIVWMLYKGSWYEEMINNRNKSVVRGMAWSPDGQKICIAYEDGAVIVGSVEGHRLWGKELKNVYWTAVQWSPDAKYLLFGSRNGEAHLYDDQGIFLTKLENLADSLPQTIIAIHWYDGKQGHTAVDCPVLAVCFQNGRLCLLRDVGDDLPIVVETGLSVASCNWNTYGSVLAVAGVATGDDRRLTNVVQFYSAFGEHLKTLKVPGKRVSGCSWEGGSLRVCLSVDSNIFFANIRPSYKWAYFSNTVVFTDERVSKDGICITFWDTKSNARYFKYVRSLVAVAAHGEHCVLLTGYGPVKSREEGYMLLVCNAISTPVDTKYLQDIEPAWVAINSGTVVVASRTGFLLWNFRVPKNSALNAAAGAKLRKDRTYHVDDTPTGVNEVIRQDLESLADSPAAQGYSNKDTSDPICGLAITDQVLLVARNSGMVQQYSLPQVTLARRHATGHAKPSKLFINCDSTRVAMIDGQDVLRLLDLTNTGSGIRRRDDEEERLSKFERKDAWAVCWAQDNPRLVAILEKSRMYVFRAFEPEEPITSSGYVCCFKDLEIRCVLLDELVRNPEGARAELLVESEVKSLRDTRELLAKVGFQEAEEFVKDNPHPRLWRLLADHALRQLDLDKAEIALVHCTDYLGIQFVKKLRGIHDAGLRRAEVLAFLGSYDEAEQAYLELDRRDLAVSLRLKLADYSRAIQLMRLGASGGSDVQLEQAHARWGEQLAAKQQWREAREHLEKGRSIEKLLECHYMLEDYDQLANAAAQLPDQAPELKKAARLLAAAGLVQQAVASYVRCGDARQAVEICVRLNRWGQALELARTWKLPGIGELLGKYARHLLSSGRRLQAVELYRKADCPLEAAKLMLELASEQAGRKAPPLRLKKLYVLAALLVQEHLEASQPKTSVRSGLLLGLAEATGEDARIVQEAWRGAEAYHFLLLAHRQLYNGEPGAALRTSLRLREYEDLLEPEPIYSLLALAALRTGSLATCSRAMAKLEAIDPRYEEVSLEIFGKRSPRDLRPPSKSECLHCETLIPDYCVVCPNCDSSFPACIVSGRPLMDQAAAWLCVVCKHRATSERDVVNINGCPLCHSIITYM